MNSPYKFRFATVLVLLVASNAATDAVPNAGLEVVVETFNEWQISQSVFCPEEPVLVRVTVTNVTSDPIGLLLGYGPTARAYFKVSDDSGTAVWDTDKIEQRKEEQHVRAHGMGRILVGHGEYSHRILNPKDSAFWTDTWKQRDLSRDLVSPGHYFAIMDYRWFESNGERQAVSTSPVEIVISAEDCF